MLIRIDANLEMLRGLEGTPTWLIIALIVLAMIVFCLFCNSDEKTKAKLDGLFAGRSARDDDDYYEAFFAESEIPPHVVSRIRELFSEYIGVDLSLLEADDDFTRDYSLIWDLDSMANVEIIVALEEEFDIEISDAEAAEIRSIRAIAIWVASKLREKSDD